MDTAARTFFRRWLLWVTEAETLGFLLPTAAAVLIVRDAPEMMLPVLVAAGFGEGAVLGFAQARVLRRHLPRLSVRGWTVRTAAAAALAWGIGLAPGALEELWAGWPLSLQLVAAAPAGLLLLGALGLAQWPELRRHVHGSGWWIAGSAAAWCAGLGVFMAVASPLWEPGQPAAVVAGIGIAAGVLMAATAALVSGLVMKRLLRGPGTAEAFPKADGGLETGGGRLKL